MLGIILRVIATLGWLFIIPVCLIMPSTFAITTKQVMYGLCGIMGVVNAYESYRLYQRRKETMSPHF